MFHIENDNYYPQALPNFDRTHGTWHCRVGVGHKTDSKHFIMIATVTEDVQSLLSYYAHVQRVTGQWVPILLHDLPKGITEVHRISVRLTEKK